MSREKMPLLFREDPRVSMVATREYAGAVINNEATHPRRSMTIDAIQNLLHETIRAEIDLERLFQLGFDTMNWEMVDVPRSLYGLFLGKNKEDELPITLPEAEGIIAVSTDLHNERVVYTALDVSGVVADSLGNNRTLALRYSLPSQDLEEITVSISDEDQNIRRLSRYDTQFATPGLDTRDRYYTQLQAGTPYPMTSPAMLAQTDGHTNAVRTKKSQRGYTPLGKKLWGGKIHEQTGFFETENDAMITVGLREDHPERWISNDAPDFQTIWEVSAPRYLTPIPSQG